MKPGDKVAYSVQFLKNTGMSHSEAGHARGVVKLVEPLGGSFLVTVDWGNHESRVLRSNLAIVGTNMEFCNCD